MEGLLGILLVSTIAVLMATALFYECLCFLSRFISSTDINHRTLMMSMVFGIFIAHSGAIFIYAILYWGLTHYAGFSSLTGNVDDDFLTYLYFSITSYSSLGIGDVVPVGFLRFLAGVEAINGLILITWSAAFTYFIVQKMWDSHDIKYKGE